MTDSNKKMKDDIELSIRALFGDKDQFFRLDIDVVVNVILNYVLSSIDLSVIDDTNRFEYYYQLLGKSVAIAQGWKINFSNEVQLPSETKYSLTKYIEATYGVTL